jgi:hypothetical protein
MQLPLTDPETLFEELLQDLPPEMAHMAREFKAFVRAKKVPTPEQRLRIVFFYCGLDKSWREVAGTLTVLYEAITAQSVAERLRACGPWVQAMLRRMRPLAFTSTTASIRRLGYRRWTLLHQLVYVAAVLADARVYVERRTKQPVIKPATAPAQPLLGSRFGPHQQTAPPQNSSSPLDPPCFSPIIAPMKKPFLR